jgi:hypothetical protein
VKFKSPIFSNVSGSIGGATYAHNRGGMYVRNRTTPVNTMTPRRTAAKGDFADAVNAWSNTLDDAERESWRNYASNTPMTDQFGDVKVLSGQQMFIRSAMSAIATGASFTALAPATPGLGVSVTGITEFEIAVGGAEFSIAGNLSGPHNGAGVAIIFIGNAVSPGVQYFRGPYQFAVTIAISDTDDTFADVALSYPPLGVSSFTPLEDQVVPVRARVLGANGRLSESFHTLAVTTQASV